MSQYYEWRVGHPRPSARGGYEARADVLRKDTRVKVGEVSGRGKTADSARDDALKQARARYSSTPKPKDWQGA